MAQDRRLHAALLQEQQNKLIWADAKATVARELADELAHRPPEEQQKHKIRIGALAEVSEQLSGAAQMMSSPMQPGGNDGVAADQRQGPRGITPA